MSKKVGPPDLRVYAEAGFGGRFDRGVRPAVVVIDFSLGFTDPEAPTGSDMSVQIENTNALIAAARGIDAPVIFTRIAYATPRPDLTWVRKARGMAALTVDSPWVEIDPRCARLPGDPLITKEHASAFFGTQLHSLLTSRGVDTVILCGATTSGCVRASAVDSVSLGFPTLVGRECVADRAQAPHDAALFDLQEKYADVEPVDTLIAYIDDLSGHRSTA
ncbi:MAG: isochorismatase family protein [Janibacter sp.]